MCEFMSLSRAPGSIWWIYRYKIIILETSSSSTSVGDWDEKKVSTEPKMWIVFFQKLSSSILHERKRNSNRLHTILLGASLQNKKVKHYKAEQVRVKTNHSCGEWLLAESKFIWKHLSIEFSGPCIDKWDYHQQMQGRSFINVHCSSCLLKLCSCI